MTTYVGRLIEYNNWANLELIRFLSAVPPATLDAEIPGVYGSIRQTFAHLLNSELAYHRHLMGLPRESDALSRAPELSEIADVATLSATNFEGLIESLPPPGQFMQLWDGKRRATTIFTQLITHSCEHRTQVNMILGSAGFGTPDLDSWAYGIHVHGDDRPEDWGPREVARSQP